MIQKITQFRLGVFMILLQCLIFGMGAIAGHFNSMTILCMIFWTMWTIYFWNQRGKKCYLKIIPLTKSSIDIGDLVCESGFPLSGIKSGVTTCLVPGGQEYSNNAKPVQLVIVADEKLKAGDTYLNMQSKELHVYDPNSPSTDDLLASLISDIEDLYMKKLEILQKDMPQEFIQTVIDGKTKDGDVVIVRKNVVFREKPFYESHLLLGLTLLFLCFVIGDLVYTVFEHFVKYPASVKLPEMAKAITMWVGILVISPVLYHAIKFIIKYYKLKNDEN